MRGAADEHARDLAECRRILRAGSKSFHAASVLLPPRVRAPASVIYAFCRVADDAVDLVPREEGPAAIEALRARLDQVYRSDPIDHPVDRALARVVHQHGIPKGMPEALLDGFVWDVEGRRYETLAGVYAYSARVAAVVGVMMTLLMGRREAGVLARACDLGVAMQITNICRDVGEDARNGRIYLPLAWVRDAGVDPDRWLADPVFTPEIARIVERLLNDADRLYASADLGVPMLPRGCRPAIRAARLIYSAIGPEVRHAAYDSVSRRAVVSNARKLALVTRASAALASRSRAPREGDPPPLEEVRFLIDTLAGSAASESV